MDLKWTEQKPPTKNVSTYDHVICETPLGIALIEWKGWKIYDGYSIAIGDVYIGEGNDLEHAKELVVQYLKNKMNELQEFLKD